FRLCFPKEAARLTAGLEAEAGDADAAKPAEAAEPAGTAEEEARERTVQEMVDGLMNVSAVHDGARLAHVFADALRAADIGALHYLDRAVGRLPDTPWRQHLIAGFSMALELAEPLSYEALRALTARSLNDAPGVWKEYVLEAEDRPAQEDEQ
ncbi:MAG: hypothetical protein Q4F72_10000, partial [Desulfovibrionaceae bacterium]|nr:hypothetical protein [Desulfovibrionaceae bacterium]